MLIVLDKKNSQVSEQFSELVGSLPDGRYIVQIRELGGKTLRDYNEQYFAMIDIIRDHSGDDRYTLHDMFKTHEEIQTTKDFTLEDWVRFIDALKWWAFNNYDLLV